jgi:uncharacterized membrane protein
MESRVKIFGHAAHPILIVFPLGLLATGLGLDVAFALTEREVLAGAAYWNIAIGVVTGLVAGVFGLVDWLAIPRGTRAKRIGLFHGLGNVVVLAFFTAGWLSRADTAFHEPTRTSLVLEIAGGLLALVTGWLGGELVGRLGVGVDNGANLDAPSSLSQDAARPAHG